jgi:hypothetical protein
MQDLPEENREEEEKIYSQAEQLFDDMLSNGQNTKLSKGAAPTCKRGDAQMGKGFNFASLDDGDLPMRGTLLMMQNFNMAQDKLTHAGLLFSSTKEMKVAGTSWKRDMLMRDS